MNIPVNVLIIRHAHGENITCHLTHEGALDKLAAYVKEEWNTVTLGERPKSDGDAVQRYFTEAMGETFDIEECDLQP